MRFLFGTPLPEALNVIDFIVVDDWHQVKHHGVDVSWRAVRDKVIPEGKIRGNLGDIVAGKKKGRADRIEKIMFNPIGMGIHDLSEAFRIYKNAAAATVFVIGTPEPPTRQMGEIRPA